MAKSKSKKDKNIPPFDYGEEVRKLKEEGPGRLYFVWGPEDYLSDLYVDEIRKLCVPDGDADFSYRRFSERDFNAEALMEAIDSVPFMTERTMVEVRGVDLNKLGEEDVETVSSALADIPDYCTVVFVEPSEFEPDKRKKIYKKLQPICHELCVTTQSNDAMIRWVMKRFAAEGKRIEINTVQRLLFISGELMNKLIPEISKIVSYSKGNIVTVEDVEAVAHHIPESVVFEMTEALGNGETGKAMSMLDELLVSKECDEFAVIAILGMQMRKLYAAKLASENGLGADFLKEDIGIKPDFVAKKLIVACRRYSLSQLKYAVELCEETEFRFKSTGGDRIELLKECIMKIAVGGSNV